MDVSTENITCHLITPHRLPKYIIQLLPEAGITTTLRSLSEEKAGGLQPEIVSSFKLAQKSRTTSSCWSTELFILNVFEIRQTIGSVTNIRHLVIIIDYVGGEVNVHAMMITSEGTLTRTLTSMRVKRTKLTYRKQYIPRINGLIYDWKDDCHHWSDLKCGLTDIIVTPSPILGSPVGVPNLHDLMRTPGKISNYNHWTGKFIIKPSRHHVHNEIHALGGWNLVVHQCPKSLTISINNAQILYINNTSEFCNEIMGSIDREVWDV